MEYLEKKIERVSVVGFKSNFGVKNRNNREEKATRS